MLRKILHLIINFFKGHPKPKPTKSIDELREEFNPITPNEVFKETFTQLASDTAKAIDKQLLDSFKGIESKYLWLLDNGHGSLTKGKKSPVLENGERFFEYVYNRKVVRGICTKLAQLGIDYINVVPEDDVDDFLKERVHRANAIKSSKPKIFVSVHFNAAPSNKHGWTKAKGIETWHFHNSEVSKNIAEVFQRHLIEKTGLVDRGGKSKPTRQFYVLRNTEMAAILTENGFFNNRTEVVNLMKPEMIENIIDAHVSAILEIEEMEIV